MNNRIAVILAFVAALSLAFLGVASIGMIGNFEECRQLLSCPMYSPNQEKPQKPERVPLPTLSPESPSQPVTGPPESPGVTIQDGTWIPGKDFPLGTYETVTGDSDCIWTVGTPSVVVSDYGHGPGHFSHTFVQGEKFYTNLCGTWKKVK